MTRALALADVLRAAGLPVVEVPGWQTRGVPLDRIRGGVVHHTGTAASAGGDYPTLSVVRYGRAKLPGPLSQMGLGRSGTWYVIASGRANHAGVVHGRYGGLYDNRSSLGVEAEHPGGSAPWPAVQYASYVAGCAALGRHYGITWLGHKEVAAPQGRKVDPNFDVVAFRRALGTQAAPVANPVGGVTGQLPTPLAPSPIDPIPRLEATMSDSSFAIRDAETGATYEVNLGTGKFIGYPDPATRDAVNGNSVRGDANARQIGPPDSLSTAQIKLVAAHCARIRTQLRQG